MRVLERILTTMFLFGGCTFAAMLVFSVCITMIETVWSTSTSVSMWGLQVAEYSFPTSGAMTLIGFIVGVYIALK